MYLANFHYTVGQNYRAAIKLSDEVFSLSLELIKPFELAENSDFPVLLTSHLIRVFDREIQTVFGFVTLARRLSGLDDDDAVLALCPVMFAHYAKVRCLARIGADDEAVSKTLGELSKHQAAMHFFSWTANFLLWATLQYAR